MNRKARTTPGPGDDTGSPWAIGSKDGGHDAIHPDLGGFDDFDAFVARAGELGLGVALDLALQAAPDHPWVKEHPEWFTTRADGTIAYAENPPKYQDIYPATTTRPASPRRCCGSSGCGCPTACASSASTTRTRSRWRSGSGCSRRSAGPTRTCCSLAEAFTRPAMMRALGAVGFQQSYTYFTWRNAKWEIEDLRGSPARPTT